MMKFLDALLVFLLAHCSTASQEQDDVEPNSSRKLTALSEDCKIVFAELLTDRGSPDMEGEFACERIGGFINRIEFFDDDQKEKMMNQLKSGDLLSGTSILKKESIGFLPEGDHDGVIYLPSNSDLITIETDRDLHRRRLDGDVFGDKPILGVRVTDGDGKVYRDNAATMRDNIFGSSGDSVNLKSQLSACSHNKLNIVDRGVIDVRVSTRLAVDDRYKMHNAVTAAVNKQERITLPGPYEQVMYMMEGCYVSCGYAAYAYVNSWMSVYQSRYYYMTGVQVHELGHNFGLAHSGIQGGGQYTDHTCMMGNPLYSDDVGKMCYNPAKNWDLGWYDDKKDEIDITRNNFCETKTLYGIANYNSNTASTVIVKLETGTSDDYFVGFNRATGANADNDMADDEVTIIKTGKNGQGYSQSWLQADLTQGQSKTLDGTKITATTINIGANPGYAIVSFEKGTCNNNPTRSPTNAPVRSPTKSPTAADDDDDDDGDYYGDDDSECPDGDTFAINQRKTKTCEWLAGKTNTKIKKFCEKKWRYVNQSGVVYSPPNKVCLTTCDPYTKSCDACYEYEKSKWFFKVNRKGKVAFRSCKWLKTKDAAKINQYCNQDSKGAFPKAKEICPKTCGTCN